MPPDDLDPAGSFAPGPEETEARARLGRSLRDLGHAVVGHHIPVEVLDDAAVALDEIAESLRTGERRSRPVEGFGFQFSTAPADGSVITTYIDRPVSGAASPWGLDAVVRRDGEEIVASFELRAGHEGAPGRSHGGIVAALFDDLMGFVLQLHQLAAYTGELTVRYEAGVPLHQPLEIRARLAAREGRKLRISAELLDAKVLEGGRILARSTATFITIEAFGAPPGLLIPSSPAGRRRWKRRRAHARS